MKISNKAGAKIWLLACIAILSLFVFSSCDYSPSKELTVFSFMPPKDFSATLIINDSIEIPGYEYRKAWEVRCKFYIYVLIPGYDDPEEANAITSVDRAVLRVTANGITFDIDIDTSNFSAPPISGNSPDVVQRSFVTLHLGSKSVSNGIAASRTIALVLVRALLILAVAGALFYCFGYRKRRAGPRPRP